MGGSCGAGCFWGDGVAERGKAPGIFGGGENAMMATKRELEMPGRDRRKQDRRDEEEVSDAGIRTRW